MAKFKIDSACKGLCEGYSRTRIEETQRRREKDIQKKRTMDTRCGVCDQKGKSVYHLVCSCPALAPSLYLKVRHNQITRVLYQEMIKSDHLEPTRSNCKRTI